MKRSDSPTIQRFRLKEQCIDLLLKRRQAYFAAAKELVISGVILAIGCAFKFACERLGFPGVGIIGHAFALAIAFGVSMCGVASLFEASQAATELYKIQRDLEQPSSAEPKIDHSPISESRT